MLNKRRCAADIQLRLNVFFQLKHSFLHDTHLALKKRNESTFQNVWSQIKHI